MEWRASVANRSKSIVDANGHLLPARAPRPPLFYTCAHLTREQRLCFEQVSGCTSSFILSVALQHKKKQNSTFRYSLDPSQLKRRLHPAAMSQGAPPLCISALHIHTYLQVRPMWLDYQTTDYKDQGLRARDIRCIRGRVNGVKAVSFLAWLT